MRQSVYARAFSAMLRGALQQGPSGLQQDVALMVSPWGFVLAEVAAPTFFWQGDVDTDVTPEMARFLAGAIPGAQLRIFAGEGHLSLAVKHAPTALQALACEVSPRLQKDVHS
ncbi:alpha/beta hydrolase [Oscillochloris sp. ZM17-4]|uniref:alpha/beta fold hydrolase n=1 Tax=Oscillochloris sp. ZM17-4 TaxID=2866714 RepID=UPI001C7371E3|nr:alpha/beta hydrolase [Oscillochloris sp. ZM17-4]MBX0331109.1 alpha/beta hydrolase [Oscillochloris sp. ZM17-4]